MEDDMNPQEKLYQLIRSRYPVIVIVSHETQRVLESIVKLVDIDHKRIAARGGKRKRLYSWSVVRGLHEIGTGPATLYQEFPVQLGKRSYEPLPNPISESVRIFQHIINHDPPVVDKETRIASGDYPALYVLKDVDAYFNQPDVVLQ